MRVTSITKGRLVSGPGYNNRKVEVTIHIDEGETPGEANVYADKLLAAMLGESDAKERMKRAVGHVETELRELRGLIEEDDDIPF